MSDIVARLRAIDGFLDKAAFENGVSCSEIADTIESLRQRVKELEIENKDIRHDRDLQMNNKAWLEDELAELRKGQGEPVAFKFPRMNAMGWTIDFDVIRNVVETVGDQEWTPSYEAAEQVLLALEKLYPHIAPTIPEGWQLVPKKLTLKMLIAAKEVWFTTDYFPKALQDSYEAALAAAPEPEVFRQRQCLP